MESFGKYIREEREQRGVGIEEISRATKIGPAQLRSLENDDFAALPPIAFVKGFVRAYARHIGMDSEEAIMKLELYLSEIEEEEDSFAEMAPTKFRSASPDPRLLLIAATVFFAVIVLAMIFAIRSCGGGEGASRALHPDSDRMRIFTDDALKSLSPISPVGEIAMPEIPTVPPRSFRVNKFAQPYNYKKKKVSSIATRDQPGGGATVLPR